VNLPLWSDPVGARQRRAISARCVPEFQTGNPSRHVPYDARKPRDTHTQNLYDIYLHRKFYFGDFDFLKYVFFFDFFFHVVLASSCPCFSAPETMQNTLKIPLLYELIGPRFEKTCFFGVFGGVARQLRG